MPDFTIDDLEITPEEFVDSCSKRELKELIDYLVKDGLVSRKQTPLGYSNGYEESVYEEALVKLSGRWNMMSSAESEFIISIAKRF